MQIYHAVHCVNATVFFELDRFVNLTRQGGFPRARMQFTQSGTDLTPDRAEQTQISNRGMMGPPPRPSRAKSRLGEAVELSMKPR